MAKFLVDSGTSVPQDPREGGGLVAWLAGWLGTCLLVGWSVACLVCFLIGWLLGLSWLLGCLVAWLLGCLLA